MEPVQSKAAQGRVADAPSGHWVYRILPRWLWPYAQLARWDRPIGWQLLLWPCWWSAALAASAYPRPGDPLLSLLPAPRMAMAPIRNSTRYHGAG
ncbi:MAG: 4-hydroxybenzoate octaprenyltransferase, partial [Mesorhizobium sp.]